MASTSDIRDIMNLGQAGPRQPAPKKKRHLEPQTRVTGVKREVQALMGDSVPPIAIVEQRSYKSRPSISQKMFKPRHWGENPFQHGARTDGLQLKHWKRSIPGSTARPPSVSNMGASTDVEMTDESKTTALPEMRYEEEFPSHKWNVKVSIPSYTDEQYQNLLKSEDWTKAETDYLMELCRDYDLRWVVIADRYTPKEISKPGTPAPDGESNGSELVAKSEYPPRSQEALKQRYYAISAKLLEIKTPASNMTQLEFQDWEKMRNFDVKTEALRKSMLEKLFERTKDEADEERLLLEELSRITKNEDDFIKMRSDLYDRLEPVAPIRRTERGEEQPTAMYQTSGGLSMLLQTLLAKEKRMKRPTIPGSAEAGPSSATPTDAQKWEKGRHPNQYTRRDTTDTQAEEAAAPQKKGSTSQPVVRVLTPQDELRFGVSHPQERVTSGVQFRHEKINRLTMAKSQTQTTKIQAALTELGIPARLLMPTERVCREFERLVTEINVLLDCRKVNEKISTEIKILEESRRLRLGLPKEGNQADPAAAAGEAMDVDSSQLQDDSKIDNTMVESVAPAEDDQDAEGEDDVPAEKPKASNEVKGEPAEPKAAQVKAAADEDDAEAEEDEDETGQSQAQKPTEDDDADEDEEDEEEETKVEEDEDEDEDDEENTQSMTGVDKEEDEEEDDDEDGDDDEPQADADEDEDEDEDEDAETSVKPQNDSDAEEEDEEEDEEPEAEAESNDDEEDDEEEEEDAEAEVEEDDSDAEAEADGDEDEDDAEAGESEEDDEDGGPKEDEDEASEDEPATTQNLAPAAPARAHKRSASVMSEASRAGSNRSALGRKKRR